MSIEQQLQSVSQRLAVNRYITDEGHTHIEVDQDLIAKHNAAQTLVKVCPAHVYSVADDGTLKANVAACLECGTCVAVAPKGSLYWRYPRGGKGIAFRQG